MTATRANKVSFRGKVDRHHLAAPLLRSPGDAVIVERGKPRLLILRCPCGCGDDLLINLDRRTGKAWHLYQKRQRLTLYPSYWRDDGCGSHFILWNDEISWCYGWESEESDYWQVPTEIEEKVYAALPHDYFVNYEEIAERLDLIPWAALQACRQLVRQDKAVADKWPCRNNYRRIAPA
jgi:Family of unknown function (DUF6527)